MGKQPYEQCSDCVAQSRCKRYARYMAGDYYPIPNWCKARHGLYHALMLAEIPEEYQDAWMENFVVDSDNTNVHTFLTKVLDGDFVSKVDSGMSNIYFYGNDYGSGKTFAAATLIHEYILKAVLMPGRYDYETPLAMYVEFPELMNRIKKAQFNEDETLEEYLEHIRNCPLVLFDDVGVTKVTDYVADQAYLLFNARFRNKKTSIVTSNLTPTQLPEIIGGATASRILKKAGVTKVVGKDRRWR